MGTVFFGNVVLDSFDMAYRDKDIILNQHEYEKLISWYLNYEENANLQKYSKELIKLGFSATEVLVCIFV